MSTPDDPRIVRTRTALRQAMTELAGEAALDGITVRAIAARAGVGYATFFRHYGDKEALLADVAGMLTRQFLQQVRPLLLQQDRRAAARSLCAFVLEHLAVHQTLIAGGSGEIVRAGMLRHTMDTLAAARVREPEGPIDDLVLFHLVSATLNLLAWWMRNLDQVDTDTMAEIIERTVLTPTSALRQSPPPALTP